MKLTATYRELEEYVTSLCGKKINFKSGGEDTLIVSSPIDMLLKVVSVNVSLKVVGINSTCASFIYDGSWGMNNAVKLALKYLYYKIPELQGAIEERPDRQILIYLAKIPQLRAILSRINPQSLKFPPEGVVLSASLI